ncbi:Piso0_005279 [Millerozyma farinosa CBS 7064]|uniref:Piso0_005279 protein n=1 Tax=Pichia sorbitophila (strain ATCC MYA-4447 / BCRC 22081 / CBS 7064 / NBRC 10061 / NRRL Y-12695) TaxID=559304 RepID=G8Y4P2_PICSO|nr:Piso0_005279 [Millerozyma farinosa CBS 7064]
MNFSLKRKATQDGGKDKRPKGKLFNDNDDSDSESGDEKFVKHIEKAKLKAKRQESEKNEEIEKLIEDIDNEENEESKDGLNREGESGSKSMYMTNVIASREMRNKERLASVQKQQDKVAESAKDAIVYESAEYKEQKRKVLEFLDKQALGDDEESRGSLFYSKMLALKHGEPNNDTKTDVAHQNIELQDTAAEDTTYYKRKDDIKQSRYGRDAPTHEPRDREDSFIKGIINLIRSKVSEKEIEIQREKYHMRAVSS